RLSPVLRDAVVMCDSLITPGNCWRKTTWPEFRPSLPPGLVGVGCRSRVGHQHQPKEVLMSDTSQIALIPKFYAAMGDVNTFKSLLADDVEWDIAEGFPNGGVYRGLDTTVSDFFPFLADFDEFYAKGDEYFESGDHVIVLGHYFGVSKKGRRVQSRFAHFWPIRDGKVGRLQQTADTLLIAQALGK